MFSIRTTLVTGSDTKFIQYFIRDHGVGPTTCLGTRLASVDSESLVKHKIDVSYCMNLLIYIICIIYILLYLYYCILCDSTINI